MIKIYSPHDSPKFAGGGSTFLRNLKAGSPEDISFLTSFDGADLLFIPGPTLCKRETAVEAEKRGIPIILRVDNVPEDIRNRGTGISRLKEFASLAHVVVYQSNFGKHLLQPLIGNKGPVIYNGVDTKVFTPSRSKPPIPTFIYAKYSRNECKRFQEAQALFREYARNNKCHLILAGTYSRELMRYDFGFYSDESVEYLGLINFLRLSDAFRRSTALIFPSFGDVCPNTVLEAMSTGLPVIYNGWGGTKELVGDCGIEIDYGEAEPAELMSQLVTISELCDPRARVKEHFSLEKMCEEYAGIFRMCV